MTSSLPAAVLWDLDGTLVDTEPYWAIAEASLVREFNGEWSKSDGLELIGAGLLTTASKLQSRGVDLDPEEIVARLTSSVLEQSRAAVPWRPGALELLLSLREWGVPTALVTMSRRPFAEFVAGSTGSVLFDAIVTGEDVSMPKPNPEAYLRGASLLGVEPQDSIVLEDSIPGVMSGRAASATVIGIPAHVDLGDFDDIVIWPTLAGKSVEDLSRVVFERQARR
ncbi:MAG: HAD family phosphatase [Cryobacterium sp.]|nr:HAD family phosphatase [Cryobacterium sp.]MBX3090623.1 HAD family phosphatase [Cryobacterium sp.]MBX3116239.1 HAD family phosphatase [Cryobacterium sp.]MCO5294014.1 HAD family phosphatase [Homoserinimonas sp.]